MDAFNRTAPTLSPSTAVRYEERYLALERRYSKDAGVENMTPDEVVASLLQTKPTLSMSTFRQYKASVLYYLERHHPQHEIAIDRLRGESSAGLKKSTSMTSGPKQKFVPNPVWDVIESALTERADIGYKRAEGLRNVLAATLVTGLRPNEWTSAQFGHHAESGRPVLRIQNSKATNGRANGETRELFIDDLPPADVAAIGGAIEYCRARDDSEADGIVQSLKNELADTKRWIMIKERLNAKVRARHIHPITLYSFRHQFIADAKSTWEDPVIISAAVGHNSTKTAFEHYGKRKHAQRQVRVLPTPESVASVQNVKVELYRAFIEKRSTGGLSSYIPD